MKLSSNAILDKAEHIDILELNKQIDTYNPNPPEDGSWIKPSIHPYQSQDKDIMNTHQSDNDYIDLWYKGRLVAVQIIVLKKTE